MTIRLRSKDPEGRSPPEEVSCRLAVAADFIIGVPQDLQDTLGVESWSARQLSVRALSTVLPRLALDAPGSVANAEVVTWTGRDATLDLDLSWALACLARDLCCLQVGRDHTLTIEG